MTDPPPTPRALIIDDDPSMRLLVSMQLEMAGAAVESAVDADEALQLITTADLPFDVVVCDRRLPAGRNGTEIIAAARSRWPDARMFLLTAHIDAEAVTDAAEVDGVLVDKIDLAPILQSVAELAAGDQ